MTRLSYEDQDKPLTGLDRNAVTFSFSRLPSNSRRVRRTEPRSMFTEQPEDVVCSQEGENVRTFKGLKRSRRAMQGHMAESDGLVRNETVCHPKRVATSCMCETQRKESYRKSKESIRQSEVQRVRYPYRCDNVP